MKLLDIAITSHNEGKSLGNLLEICLENREIYNDAIGSIIVVDDFSTDEETCKILQKYDNNGVYVYHRNLDGDFAAQKNYLNSLCTSKWILQLDADEILPPLGNIIDLIENNSDSEAFWLPRANYVEGLTQEDLDRWGWTVYKEPHFLVAREKDSVSKEEMDLLEQGGFLDDLPVQTDNTPTHFVHFVPLVMWPDYQMRLYRNDPSRIKWTQKVHERLIGYDKYGKLPASIDWAIEHNKNITKQKSQNALYDAMMKQ